MELENLFIELILKLNLRIEDYLSNDRIDEINEFSTNDKYLKHKNIVYYTNLRDKFKMTSHLLLSDGEDNSLKNFIQKLIDVRNKIAHGESIIGYTFWEISAYKKTNDPKADLIASLNSVQKLDEKILFEPKDMVEFIYQLRRFIDLTKSKLISI